MTRSSGGRTASPFRRYDHDQKRVVFIQFQDARNVRPVVVRAVVTANARLRFLTPSISGPSLDHGSRDAGSAVAAYQRKKASFLTPSDHRSRIILTANFAASNSSSVARSPLNLNSLALKERVLIWSARATPGRATASRRGPACAPIRSSST